MKSVKSFSYFQENIFKCLIETNLEFHFVSSYLVDIQLFLLQHLEINRNVTLTSFKLPQSTYFLKFQTNNKRDITVMKSKAVE